ncbi:MAG: Gfo/Idh/MocA family oxidoreductase [Chloroflexi bacterium]|nr:Gfo/Idh/MocA family oxidoreductase [Chloroflexota bacterium]
MAAMYRVGIVGLGRVASSIQEEVAGYAGRMLLPYSHTHAYAAVPQTRVCAVADVDPQKTAAYVEQWEPECGEIAVHSSYEDMLQREDLDIVSVCTHAPLHAPVTLAAAEAGVKAVFCEKAIATSLAEADKMVAACDERNVKLVINHTRRWDPYYETALALIADGRIGNVRTISAHFAGVLIHTGIHWLDVMLMFSQSPAAWVMGILAPGADVASDAGGTAYVGFHNGVMGFIDGQSGPVFEIDVIGTAGRLRLSSSEAEFFTFDSATRTMVKRPFPLVAYPRSGMQGAVEEILRCIEEDRPSRSDGRVGRAALELALAVYASHASNGARVHLPLSERDRVVLSR